jgi:CPA2 family monovalent cation:H+ antiporter-2
MDFGIFETLLVVLATTLLVSVIFRRFKIPVIVGFLFVGALMGPHGLKLMPNTHNIREIAEFGIVFLMFTVGLEFSKPKLWALKKAVFVIGSLQVFFSIVITAIIGHFLGMTMLEAWVVGGIVAMSSTAIVIKQLDDQSELYTTYGLNAIGILLFQDMAVIPFVIFIVALASHAHSGLPYTFLMAFIKGGLAVMLITFSGRFLLKPLFHQIAKTHAIELFTLSVILITLTAAWVTNQFGLSYSLGAFVAGIMLSETEFRHQIEVEIRPFRDILLGLFFITIGMLADVGNWHMIWKWVALLLTALIFGKMLLVTLICRLFGNDNRTSLQTGMIVAQGSEFGFAILTLAMNRHMLPTDYGQVVLAALLMSIGLSPILIYFNKRISGWFFRKSSKLDDESIKLEIFKKAKKMRDHIIICGYGRVGQQVGRLLRHTNHPYLALDIDAEVIQKAKQTGDHVLFGDASHPEILRAAGIKHAKALVISFDDINPSKNVLSMVRKSHAKLPTIVRCEDQIELQELKEFSPTNIVVQKFEEGLMLSEILLQLIKEPSKDVVTLIKLARSNEYEMLRSG